MTYQVLARKWRPKDFASLVGQEHVVKALTHALDGGRIHHAYLFTGTRGVGKTTLSRIFAKALNCETGITSQPCGVCRACREIDEGRFVDYIEMDAASNRGVDEMAALLERAVYAPVDARFKVYMIDEVHMLTNHAFNAMLKTLEEPPPHVKFILATTDPQKIPVTVLSRCLQFNLKQMPAGHIVEHLERILGEERVAYEAQALRLLARAAQGSMRDALSLTDQAIAYAANNVTEAAVAGMLGTLDQTYLMRLLDALAGGDGPGVLAIADEMALRSLSFSTALQDLAGLLHRIAWAQFAPGSVLEEWPEAGDLRRFAQQLAPEQVQLWYQIATVGRGELGLAPDEYAGFTMTLLRMLAFELGSGGRGGATPGAQGATMASAGRAAPAMAGAHATPVAVAAAKPAATERIPTAAPMAAAKMQAAATPAAPMTSPAAPAVAPEREMVDAVAVSAPLANITEPIVEARSAAEMPADAATDAAPAAVAPAIESAAPVAQAPISEFASSSATAAPDAERASNFPAPAPAADTAPNPAVSAPGQAPAARMGGAAAALDVLRNAGMRVSSDRGKTAKPAEPVAPAAVKPRATVEVRMPSAQPPASAAAAQSLSRPQPSAAPAAAPNPASSNTGASIPPWDEIPPDDAYVPLSADEAFDGPPPDADFEPAFGHAPIAVQKPAARPAPTVVPDINKLPPAIALDAIGHQGEWPSLASSLPLSGIAQQLACNSELAALDGSTLNLLVPVKQYADAAHVDKLKAALAEALGRTVELSVTIAPVRRTAAALDGIARAQRQREAEQQIDADPFVQQLIRDFGAHIVEGSVRPLPAGGEGARGH